MRHVLAVGGLLVCLAGCSEHVNVSVNCKTMDDPIRVECEVAQTQGKTEVEACWDFSVQCGNGAVVKAKRTCAKVSDGGKTTVTVTRTNLDGLDKCGGNSPPTGKLSNMTINGKPSK